MKTVLHPLENVPTLRFARRFVKRLPVQGVGPAIEVIPIIKDSRTKPLWLWAILAQFGDADRQIGRRHRFMHQARPIGEA